MSNLLFPFFRTVIMSYWLSQF
uniref:Uncharacterized protein n=1 Tax=Arundo donax TaxID=35708 RepID=A0A0A9G2R6_ARUDO